MVRGIVPILMDAKYPIAHVEGLEYQEDYAEMAERSVHMNGQSERVYIRPRRCPSGKRKV